MQTSLTTFSSMMSEQFAALTNSVGEIQQRLINLGENMTLSSMVSITVFSLLITSSCDRKLIRLELLKLKWWKCHFISSLFLPRSGVVFFFVVGEKKKAFFASLLPPRQKGHLIIGCSLYYTRVESCRLRKVPLFIRFVTQVKLTAKHQCVFDAKLVHGSFENKFTFESYRENKKTVR